MDSFDILGDGFDISGDDGYKSVDELIDDIIKGNGPDVIKDSPLNGTGHGLGDLQFDDEGNYIGVYDPYDYSKLLEDYYKQIDLSNSVPNSVLNGQGDSDSDSGLLDKLLRGLGDLGSGALKNLTNSDKLLDLLLAGYGMYSDKKNAQQQTANTRELMRAQDPWVDEYKKFIPQMQDAWNKRESNPMYQMRNQAATQLMQLAQNPQDAAPRWR